MKEMEPMDYLEFEHRDHWRNWLEKNHAVEPRAWLVIHRKGYKDLGVVLEEAVEEALCYGWIDGKLKSIDEMRFALRFSPRAENSIWSISNIRRVEKLTAEGRMTRAGLLKVVEARENGEWDAAIRREQVDIIPADLEAELIKIDGALDAYRAIPDSHKKRYIYWLQSAKREPTRRRRILRIIDQILD